ncbi:MAG: hypothetical protein EZS28_012859 [Streblomastix strix]|uniref:Proteasome activator PA28 C-terminal domain-containing protein n=1 Tax=Streblomastix strix TaxID=222440 RepID=A0A5J4W9L6_9EUKA|nr:MAG: hypothetical protein EZS28_012859 [Streblomastix strix]
MNTSNTPIEKYKQFISEQKNDMTVISDNARVRLRAKIEELEEFATQISAQEGKVMEGCVSVIEPGNKYQSLPINNDLLEIYRAMKIWILVNVAPMHDGGNFILSVQSEVTSVISSVENSSQAFLSTMFDYHMDRSLLTEKLRKFPQFTDVVTSLQRFDRKMYIDMLVSVRSIRDDAAQVLDVIQKNENHIIE